MSVNKINVTANYLRALADVVERLSEREIDNLLNSVGLTRLVSTPGSLKSKVPANSIISQNVKQEAEQLLSYLSLCASRVEAYDMIGQVKPTKRVLLEAARSLDLYTDKADRNGNIIDRLIAHTVGSRLDTAAIRGKKGTSE